jgi:hypothetical protein
MLVLHDDADREFDYADGAEEALDQAAAKGWTVVVEVLENGLHIVRVPRRHPLPAEGNRVDQFQSALT